MNDREKIFDSIQKALAPLPARTPYPEWETDIAICRKHPEFETNWELFSYRLKAVNGIPLKGLYSLAAHLKGAGEIIGYCAPELYDVVTSCSGFEGITLLTEFDRKKVDDYQFGITTASGAIAESGTVVLKDSNTPARLGALAPWTHIAIVTPDKVFASIPETIEKLFDRDPSIVFATGPSKTADVEGILIEGVHGPGIQICCLLEEG